MVLEVVEFPVVDAQAVGDTVEAGLHGCDKVVFIASPAVGRAKLALNVDLAGVTIEGERRRTSGKVGPRRFGTA